MAYARELPAPPILEEDPSLLDQAAAARYRGQRPAGLGCSMRSTSLSGDDAARSWLTA